MTPGPTPSSPLLQFIITFALRLRLRGKGLAVNMGWDIGLFFHTWKCDNPDPIFISMTNH